jgi:hypothetical protein
MMAMLVALRDAFSPLRETYSQSGKDCVIESLLEQEKITSRFYIDVGATTLVN